ncbi:MAG: hypothetical protein ACI4TY_00545, partial [Candidatus Limosilactobacillus intestinavium]
EVIFMNLLRGIFYTTAGILFTLFYREGMHIAMNWVFLIWMPIIAWDFAMWATPYQRNKKSASRRHD